MDTSLQPLLQGDSSKRPTAQQRRDARQWSLSGSLLSLFLRLLLHLPINTRLCLAILEKQLLQLKYHYFPKVRAKHLCQVCQTTLAEKEHGFNNLAAFTGLEEEMSGQERFEVYGDVQCPHHWSVEALKRSAAEGCAICSRIVAHLGPDSFEQNRVLDQIITEGGQLTFLYINHAANLDYRYMQNFPMFRNCLIVASAIREQMLPNAPPPVSFVVAPPAECFVAGSWRPSIGTTRSGMSWYRARFWYDMCTSEHAECNAQTLSNSPDEQWYPTRLLKYNWKSRSLRLVETATERPTGPYAAMSHCWGQANLLQLTRETMAGFLERISISQLPLTFRHMLIVLRRLGIAYVWVDSLCIIQQEPSLDDWKLEAPQMAEVYSSAKLVIAATGAQDSSKGLFFPYSDPDRRMPEVSLENRFKERRTRRYTMIDRNYWRDLLSEEPLLKRAWVVQERLLAPRVLHFGAHQIFWECKMHQASEDFPDGGVMPVMKVEDGCLFKASGDTLLGGASTSHPNGAHFTWQRALSVYTKCALTNQSDKLIAISGIAKRLHADLGSEYLAGLWKEWLPTEMLWYVDLSANSHRSMTYLGPSFSWASVVGPTVPGAWQEQNILVTVKTARSTQHEVAHPFGAVSSAFVRLSGTLKRASIRVSAQADQRPRNAWALMNRPAYDSGPRGTQYSDQLVPPQRWSLRLEEVYAPTNIEPPWPCIGRKIRRNIMEGLQRVREHRESDLTYGDLAEGLEESRPEMAEESFDLVGAEVYIDEELFDGSETESREVFLVLITAQDRHSHWFRGLILEPTRHGEGEYRRLGMFKTAHSIAMNVLAVPHRSEARILCENYDPETHQHTFTIV